MQYAQIIPGVFCARPNRFIAHVETNEGLQVCHVKNTGRCRELLVPGATVYIERTSNPARKTAFDLIAVDKGGVLINMDAQAPNTVFAEWAAAGGFLPGLTGLRREFTYGESRFDFRLETPAGIHFVEVKGVTLEAAGHARFPDAPTERGVKHIRELQRAVEEGYGATIFFVVQLREAVDMAPNDETHPAFGQALREAAAAGVGVRAFNCFVTPERLEIDREIPVLL